MTKAKYTVWIKSSDVVGPASIVGDKAKTAWGKFVLQFPQIPQAEKFILQCEQFCLNGRSNSIVNGINPLTGAYETFGEDEDNRIFPNAYVELIGFSSQSGWKTTTATTQAHSMTSNLIATRFSTSPLIGETNGQDTNAVNPDHMPSYVVDRPRNGTYEVHICAAPSGFILCQGGETPATDNNVDLGEWLLGISLTPMTNDEIKDWDCRS
jgi:hypothetical protein